MTERPRYDVLAALRWAADRAAHDAVAAARRSARGNEIYQACAESPEWNFDLRMRMEGAAFDADWYHRGYSEALARWCALDALVRVWEDV